MSTLFSALPLSAAMLDNLASLGFEAMTPIQAQSLPSILQGRDVIAKAKTGSGKTAAFTLGILQRLNPDFFGVQALVLCPTRELADQVSKEIRRLARCIPHIKVITLCGGSPMGPQIGSLEHGAHIVVGTPGRLQDHLHRQTLKLDRLSILVLDEADRMLDMGFAAEVDDVLSFCPKRRQTLLFSATYPESIRELSDRIQHKPLEVTVEAVHSQQYIDQLAFAVKDNAEKPQALKQLLAHYLPESAVIFCNTKIDCEKVAEELRSTGFDALSLHGDLEQRDRDLMLLRFANKSCPLLVATDMAARGLDIKELKAVINYELPHDPEVYIHRIGRTGRAGQKGVALSLVAPSQNHRLGHIEAFIEQPLKKQNWETLTIADKNKVKAALSARMVTLCLDSGRKNKMRPGDVVGALTGEAGLPFELIGKIDLFDHQTFVAVDKSIVDKALRRLQDGKIKGRSVKVKQVS